MGHEILTGEKFSSWTVSGREGRHLLVTCDCGGKSRVLPHDLRAGKSKRCSSCKYALQSVRGNPKVRTHGLADSPTQRVWSDMKRRCLSPNRRGYERYGGRGIRICDRWVHGDGASNGFQCFIDDMGVRPSLKHQLDRIDNDGHYEPSNCRWATREEQDYNKKSTLRLQAFGRTWTTLEAEQEFGIPRRVILHRVCALKMPHHIAITKAVAVVKKRKPQAARSHPC